MTIKNLEIEYFPRYSNVAKKSRISELVGDLVTVGEIIISSPLDNKSPTTIKFGPKFRRESFVYGEYFENNYPPTSRHEISLRRGKFELQFKYDDRSVIIIGDNVNCDPKDLQK